MAYSDLRSASAAHRYNSAIIAIRECSGTGEPISAIDWKVLPYCDGQSIERAAEEAELKDGSNAVIAATSSLTNYKLKANLLQCNKEIIDILNGSTGKYYNVFFNQGVVNSKHVEWVFPICKVTGSFSVDMSDWNKIPIEFASVNNAAQAVISCTVLVANTVASGTTFTVPASAQVVIVET